MLERIQRWLAPPVFEGDQEKTRQARLLNTVLLVFLVPLIAYGIGAVGLPNKIVAWGVVSVVLTLDVVSLVLVRRGRTHMASLLFCVGIWLFLSMVCVLFGGMSSPALYGLVFPVVMAGLFIGRMGAYSMAALSVAGAGAILWADMANRLPRPIGGDTPWANFLIATLYIILIAILLQTVINNLNEALNTARRAAGDLEVERGRLEEAVELRTRDVSRRSLYLEAAAAVAHDAAQVLDLQELMSGVVSLIADRFGFYHCAIFLLDPTREWALLQAASSEGGQHMLERGHRLRVGDEGIVGYVTGHGEPRVALDVGADAVFFDNPDLPATRSELALPLRARGELIGALDAQSTQPRAFSEEDAAMLQTLADQVAVAISNARLFRQAQESLEAERQAYAKVSREGWIDMLRSRPGFGFHYSQQGVLRVADDGAQAPVAGEDGTGISAGPDGAAMPAGPAAGSSALAMPILHRGEEFGSIEAHKQEGGEWTPAEKALMQALADQLSVALESARLFQDARRHAAHEQAVRHITEQMRRALEVEAILQTTVAELGQALGVPRAYVRLGTAAPPQQTPAGDSPPRGGSTPEGYSPPEGGSQQ